jgi:hypothetical protein
VLHELAHAMTSHADGRPDGHGLIFMGVYVRLIARYLSTITLNAGSVVMQSLSPGTEHLPVVGGGETPHITDCEAIG